MRLPSEILDRLPPSSKDDEMRLLASIVLKPSCLDAVAEIVKAEDFYADANRRVYGGIAGLLAEGKPVDVSLLVERLKRTGEYQAVGGAAYLAEIASSAATAAYALHYAEIVSAKSKLRAIIAAGSEMLRDAYDPGSTPMEAVQKAEEALAAIGSGLYSTKLVTAEEAALAAMDRVDEMTLRSQTSGVFTGIEKFDDKIGGLFPSEMTVLSARSGVGKSALACQVVAHNASRGRLCYVASLEMDPSEVMLRMICTAAGVDSRLIRTNALDAAARAKLASAASEASHDAIRFDPRPELTVDDIRRSCRKLMRDDLRLIVIDYLQILTPTGDDESRERQIAKMAQKLKALARELKLPLLVLCQSNREGGKKGEPPSLRHLRESDAIGQNADVVLMLETGAIGTPEAKQALLTIAKNRNGPTGKIELHWEPQTTKFMSYAPAAQRANYERDFEPKEF